MDAPWATKRTRLGQGGRRKATPHAPPSPFASRYARGTILVMTTPSDTTSPASSYAATFQSVSYTHLRAHET